MALSKQNIIDLCHGDDHDQARAARLSKCPPEYLEVIATQRLIPGGQRLWAPPVALRHPAVPHSAIVATLAAPLSERTAGRYDNLLAALSNTGTTPEQLSSTAMKYVLHATEVSYPKPWQIGAIAAVILANPNCPRELMDWAVSCPLSPNPTAVGYLSAGDTKEGLLNILGVRALQGLSRNPALPEDLARVLLRQRLIIIRKQTVANTAVSARLLEELSNEKSPAVLSLMIKRLAGAAQGAAIDRLLARTTGAVMAKITAATHTTEPERVAALCLDGDKRIRKRAAANGIATDTDKVTVALLG